MTVKSTVEARKGECKFFKSAEEICAHYGWSRSTFLFLVGEGLPARKVGKRKARWYAHQHNVDAFMMKYTMCLEGEQSPPVNS